MHLQDAKERLEELVERVGGGDFTLEELQKGGSKGGFGDVAKRHIARAGELLVGDEQALAYRYVRAAIVAAEVHELHTQE